MSDRCGECGADIKKTICTTCKREYNPKKRKDKHYILSYFYDNASGHGYTTAIFCCIECMVDFLATFKSTYKRKVYNMDIRAWSLEAIMELFNNSPS